MKKRHQTFLFWGLAVAGCLAVLLLLFSFRHGRYGIAPQNSVESGYLAYEAGDYSEAIRYFSQAELENIPEAAFALGAMYFAGKGVPINVSRALTFYEKAAILQYAPAQLTLALLYVQGDVVPKNLKKAQEYAEKAAENGDREAQAILGGWYENGLLEKRDMDKAVKYYKAAALAGDMNSKTALYAIYKQGMNGVSENVYTAMRWNNSLEKQKEFELIFSNQPIPQKKLKPRPQTRAK